MLIVREAFSSSHCSQQVLPGAGLWLPVMFVASVLKGVPQKPPERSLAVHIWCGGYV